jgi:predicted RNA-binding Zn-ribbon protein involved in translation (DUF1610 family)
MMKMSNSLHGSGWFTSERSDDWDCPECGTEVIDIEVPADDDGTTVSYCPDCNYEKIITDEQRLEWVSNYDSKQDYGR